ncbi:MAG: hypothetical protein ACYDC6_06180 [Acidobacteriaceae bacterium]
MRSSSPTAIGLMFLVASLGTVHGQNRTVLSDSRAKRPKPIAVPSTPAPAPITSATLAAGLPLRVQVIHRYRIHKGTHVQGFLIDPVYSVDHVVLPAHTSISGTIVKMVPRRRSTLVWAKLNGDFTPLKKPLIHFDSIVLQNGTRLPIDADASERTAELVKMGPPGKKKSRIAKVGAAIHQKLVSIKQGFSGAVHSHHKSDKALQILYGQLPYHPQEIWAGTQFDADLAQPLKLATSKPIFLLPVTPPHGHIPPGTLDARLDTALTSKTDKVGTPVEAVLTQPYLAADKKHVILPEGTHLVGLVTQAKPARVWGRNGTLRFTFRQVKLPTGTMEKVHAQMTAVEGKKGQNVTLDSEGGAHANSDQGKYVDPLLLGYLAGANAVDANQNQVDAADTSNGFGLPARVISILFVSGTTIAYFAYYSLGQSVTRRWIMRGHEVVFAKNTRMALAVSDR